MIKYLIFKNEKDSGKSNLPGSPEEVACDIARTVEMDGNGKDAFIAYPADTPQATFEALKSLPCFAVELDQKKIDNWNNEAEPLLEKIYTVHDALGNAYSMIMAAIHDLESDCESSELFKELDLTGDMDIDSAFEHIENPSEYLFAEHVAEAFGVHVYEATK